MPANDNMVNVSQGKSFHLSNQLRNIEFIWKQLNLKLGNHGSAENVVQTKYVLIITNLKWFVLFTSPYYITYYSEY